MVVRRKDGPDYTWIAREPLNLLGDERARISRAMMPLTKDKDSLAFKLRRPSLGIWWMSGGNFRFHVPKAIFEMHLCYDISLKCHNGSFAQLIPKSRTQPVNSRTRKLKRYRDEDDDDDDEVDNEEVDDDEEEEVGNKGSNDDEESDEDRKDRNYEEYEDHLRKMHRVITGGIYMASTVDASCRAWNLKIIKDKKTEREVIGMHGNIEHLRPLLPEAYGE